MKVALRIKQMFLIKLDYLLALSVITSQYSAFSCNKYEDNYVRQVLVHGYVVMLYGNNSLNR